MKGSGTPGQQIRASETCLSLGEAAKETLCAGTGQKQEAEQGEKLYQRLVNKHFAPLDQWGQEVQLIINEAKKKKRELGVASMSGLDIGIRGGYS